MKKPVLVIVVVVLVAVGVLAGWSLARLPDAAPAPAAAQAAGATSYRPARPDAAAESPSAMPPSTRTPATAAAPAGPVAEPVRLDDRPLVQQLADADARVRQGDATAACDLGLALTQCLRLSTRVLTMSPDYIARQPEAQQGQLTDLAARMETRRERLVAACEGIERERHLGLTQQYLLAAATRGQVAARAEFLNFPFGAADLIRSPELGRVYAANAPRLFQAMWDDGDVSAIWLLSQATGSMSPDFERAAVVAIPENLRSEPFARALRERLTRATQISRQMPGPPPRPPGYTPPPLDPAVVAEAERVWNERFEHSDSVRAMRQRNGAPQRPGLEAPSMDSLFPHCEAR